jgi:alpha-1,2-mannosyltransferase
MDTFMELTSSRDILEDPNSNKPINVCVGKEWYRFPSSFFLPSTKYSIRFINSEFRGMLPAYYTDEENATQIPHDYFNDRNKGDNYMIFKSIENCDFLVDLDLKAKKTPPLEPNYSADTERWTILKEIPFLNAHQSHPIYRAFYIPFVSFKYIKHGSFNLLQKIVAEATTSDESVD